MRSVKVVHFYVDLVRVEGRRSLMSAGLTSNSTEFKILIGILNLNFVSEGNESLAAGELKWIYSMSLRLKFVFGCCLSLLLHQDVAS